MTIARFPTAVDALLDLARELLAESDRLTPDDVGGILASQRTLHRVVDRLDALDPAAAAELDAERRDADAADPAAWPAWTDAECWELDDPAGGEDLGLADPADAWEDQGDDDAPPDADLDLAHWIAAQAARYQSLLTDAGAMVAETLRELASLVRLTGATTPAVARDRLASLERDAVDDMRHAGLATLADAAHGLLWVNDRN
jgi:hypothetical protein